MQKLGIGRSVFIRVYLWLMPASAVRFLGCSDGAGEGRVGFHLIVFRRTLLFRDGRNGRGAARVTPSDPLGAGREESVATPETTCPPDMPWVQSE